MWSRLLRGAAAGAAGTTALNAVTYLDMAVRGRPASSTPEQTVSKLSSLVGLPLGEPADGEEAGRQSNRLQGLAALTGLATGVAIGAAWAGVDEATGGRVTRLGGLVGGVVAGGAALVGANGPMVALGVTDPRTWTVGDWVSDVLPHLAYGLVTGTTYAALVD
jgi:phage-related minor tail protein